MTLKELPFDVYVHILGHLPVSAQIGEGPRTLAACLLANSILRSAASAPTLWVPHYRKRYTVSDPSSELLRTQTFGDDWKSRYVERVHLDQRAIKSLNSIVLERDGRLERSRELTSTFSYDVWNALSMEAHPDFPSPFRGLFSESPYLADEEIESDADGHAIPRRFWAQAILGTIARSHAVRVWNSVRDKEEDDSDELEIAIACLSSYFAYPPMEISSLLDVLANLCRTYLADKGIATNPDDFNHSKHTLGRISSSICDFLWENGYRAAGHSRFNLFNTRFPHWFLSTHRDTIPVSLVYIFVCIARRLGMRASPVDFPARVLAIVSSPEPGVPDVIIDVFGSRSAAILSVEEDIPRLLVDAGVSPSGVTRYIRPASTASMVVRASRNILASFSLLPPMQNVPDGEIHTAFYVGLTVNLIFMNDRRYLLNIMKHIGRFPLDILAVLTDGLAPGLDSSIQDQLLASCKAAHEDEDEAAATVTLRSNTPTSIKHFVGMIFKHVRYEYIGYVYGWEPSCMASENWIMSMHIDSLPRGRHQPFYHVLTQNGSVRYVAEDNMNPTTLEPYASRTVFQQAPEAGRYFEGVAHSNGRARLRLSPELLAAYPEDNAVGERWIRDGTTNPI